MKKSSTLSRKTNYLHDVENTFSFNFCYAGISFTIDSGCWWNKCLLILQLKAFALIVLKINIKSTHRNINDYNIIMSSRLFFYDLNCFLIENTIGSYCMLQCSIVVKFIVKINIVETLSDDGMRVLRNCIPLAVSSQTFNNSAWFNISAWTNTVHVRINLVYVGTN